jgi:hypothetical protein
MDAVLATIVTAASDLQSKMISSRIKLITWLFQRLILSPAKVLSADPFGRGYLRHIRQIHGSHALGGANGSTMVMMFVG